MIKHLVESTGEEFTEAAEMEAAAMAAEALGADRIGSAATIRDLSGNSTKDQLILESSEATTFEAADDGE